MLQPTLKLTILASHGNALAGGAWANFDATGGNIGCAADSTLRLSDDDTVTERHALIRAQYGAWCLLNISGHAVLTVNGKPLCAGQETRLQSGDIVNIGSYVLQATESVPPAWDFQMHRPPAPTSQNANLPPPEKAAAPASLATPPMEPLAFGRLDGLSANEPPSAGLDGLLDTPVDPLALFGAPGQGWSNTTEAHSADLFADLAGGRSAGGFESAATDGLRGFALRDDVPEHSAPLRLKIANVQTLGVDAGAEAVAHAPAAFASTGAAVQPAFAAAALAAERAADLTVPQYGEHSQVRAAFRHGAPVRLNCTNTPARLSEPDSGLGPGALHEPQSSYRDASATALIALGEAFLDGAGVHPDRHIEAGLTPEFMRALGAIARALQAR